MIRLRGVVRSYGATRVLAGVNLDVARGESIVITGTAGCGKTTLLRLLAGLARADSGTVEIDGTEIGARPRALRKKVALADGWLAPGDEITAGEYIQFAAGRGAASHLVRAGLNASVRLSSLDTAERVRLSIGCALASRRDVILIDAPLDAMFDRWIGEVRESGSTLVVTSPVDGARVLQLRAGRLEPVASSSPRAMAVAL